jgi:RNA polymerase sigma-54 factor
MKITIGQQLSQKQTQALAPRMIQSMEILQMPMAALAERIEQELIENPALERAEGDEREPVAEAPGNTEADRDGEQPSDIAQKELVVDDEKGSAEEFERLLNLQQDVPDHFDGPRPSSNRVQESSDRHHDMIANVADRSSTLQDHLLEQLKEWELEPELQKMCHRIISSLSAGDGGYLRVSLADLLPVDASEEDSELAEDALATVQSLEPAGVAARDLRECLLLQLTHDIEHLDRVRNLIMNHLEDLQHNRLPQIQKATGYTIDEINEAWGELRTLDPKPASQFADSFVPSVTPDLTVIQEEDGRYLVKMDEGPVRHLNISNYYRQRLANGQATAEEKEFIKRKIVAAQWLIESIEQRRSTLTKVAQAIVDHQTAFLDNGPEFLEPLKMQQIADRVGVHVTTVSRAVDDKYLESPRGIFALRKFFVGGTTTDSGEDVAWNKIRIELQKLIDGEDKAKPYSDDEIVKRLKALGFPVARRTVTKYRKKLNIPSSRQRRDWSKKK